MHSLWRRVKESLTAKVVVALGLLIFVGTGAFWYASIQTDKDNLMDFTVSHVSSFSEVVKRSIRNDMLLFQREDIQLTLDSIGASEAINRISIFDSKGKIHYSTDKSQVGLTLKRGNKPCAGCHLDERAPKTSLAIDKQWTIYEAPEGNRVFSFVEPIFNEPDCSSADCHAHNPGQKILGIMMTDFSLRDIDARIDRQVIDNSIYLLAFIAFSATLLYFILWKLVLRPVRSLSVGMKSVKSGELSHKVSIPSEDEIGRLASTFNAMTDELSTARRRMERWTQSLEEEVDKKAKEIKRTQDKLIQSEKLAAVGRLTADVAHEIRNPLTALGGFARRLQKLASTEKQKEYADILVSEVNRLEQVLRDVLTFSRDARFNYQRTPLTDTVKKSLSTFAELCRESSISVETRFSTDLPVLVDSDQLRQCIDNLVSNAIDAMPRGGTLLVSVQEEALNNITYVALHVSDSGPGIPEENLPLIFEPFYSTKNIGHGTGLGLSISRKVIEEIGGFIKAENKPDGGLTISLYFPYQSKEDMARTPCWEFMKCGRDHDNEVKCPTYPHFGRVCWVVAGTFCEGKVQGTFAQKLEDCRKCEFYKLVTSKGA